MTAERGFGFRRGRYAARPRYPHGQNGEAMAVNGYDGVIWVSPCSDVLVAKGRKMAD